MTTNTTVHVVAVPYPGRGHVNPMLHLSSHLANAGALVTVVVTEEWQSLILAGAGALPAGIRVRSIPNVIPSEFGRANDFAGFLEAVHTRMGAPFEQLLDGLDGPAVAAVVADVYCAWAVAAGNRRGVPVASVCTMSATFFTVYHNFSRLPFKTDDDNYNNNDDEPLDRYISSLSPLTLADVKSLISFERILKVVLDCFSWVPKAQFLLFTSYYELEPEVIDTLRFDLPFPVYAVGPSIPYQKLEEKAEKLSGNIDCLKWLDDQPNSSVLYVSLGSFLSVSHAQMDELVAGLLASETRFLWVLRDDSKTAKIMRDGPGLGLVVPWCDQLRVLCHPAVGGFLTHCGWNSTLEAVFAGVPMLTCPIFADQPTHSRLIVDKWKIGFSLKGEMGKDGVMLRETFVRMIKKLMDLSDPESAAVRERAQEYKEASRRAVGDGGSFDTNFDCFLRDVSKDT